jgi:hypothetical protein
MGEHEVATRNSLDWQLTTISLNRGMDKRMHGDNKIPSVWKIVPAPIRSSVFRGGRGAHCNFFSQALFSMSVVQRVSIHPLPHPSARPRSSGCPMLHISSHVFRFCCTSHSSQPPSSARLPATHRARGGFCILLASHTLPVRDCRPSRAVPASKPKGYIHPRVKLTHAHCQPDVRARRLLGNRSITTRPRTSRPRIWGGQHPSASYIIPQGMLYGC